MVITAGIIYKDGRFFIAQRRADDASPNKWEFPGGELGANESTRQCVVRELAEELGIRAHIEKLFCSYSYQDDPACRIILHFFLIDNYDGEIKLREHQDGRWVMPAELVQYDFLPADKKVIVRLIKEYGAGVPAR